MGLEGILTNCLRRVHHSCFAHCRLQLYRHTCLPRETEKRNPSLSNVQENLAKNKWYGLAKLFRQFLLGTSMGYP